MNWKFIILNRFRGRQHKSHFYRKQLAWLNRELHNDLPSLIFLHHPLKSDHFRIWCSFKSRITPKRDINFYNILERHKRYLCRTRHFWVHDYLSDVIPIYETFSFADNKKPQYLIVAVDNKAKSIRVAKNAPIID